MNLTIRPFRLDDQRAAQALILDGLREHWGWLDPTLNRDLNNIATNYAAGIFLVGEIMDETGSELVATGALLPEVTESGESVWRVVRMSVHADLRGQGIGRRLLDALLQWAQQQGARLIVVETTSTWTDAVRFYTRYGFILVEERDDETHMQLELT
jgi:GNAT superfamily N-acetyltransferase